jgi:hypothetical protein
MIELLVLTLGFLGLLILFKGRHSDTMVYEERPAYSRSSYEVPGYQDDEQIRQYRRQERVNDW